MASKKAAIPVSKKYEEKNLPEADEVLGSPFVRMADRVAKLTAERKRLDDEIKAEYAVMRAMMEDVNDAASWSVRGNGWTVSYVRPNPRETLVKELLIQQGVSIKQIEKATKKSEVQPYVTVRASEEE